ncbi:MAG TPA: hypothetical protein VFB82_12705 [Blastocatellia bacterium]|nr:hypothetical protein [Blastocatellia bacterium]
MKSEFPSPSLDSVYANAQEPATRDYITPVALAAQFAEGGIVAAAASKLAYEYRESLCKTQAAGL